MALIHTEEQAMLRASVHGILIDAGAVGHLRLLRDGNDADGFSRLLWHRFGEMGLTGILVAEEHGGQGLGHVEAGVVMEEIGQNLTPSPFLSTAILVASALARAGSASQKSAILPRIAKADLIAALAIDEGPKHRPASTAMTAKRSGNGFALDGAKSFVVDGHVADVVLVAARTAGTPGQKQGLTLFLVDRSAPGLDVERTVMVDAHNVARITFRNVEVDADAIVGEIDGGWQVLDGVLAVGRAAVAAEMCGIGDGAFAQTAAFLKERRQFGRTIGSFQALQHRAAHLYSELEVTRAAVLKALQMLDSDFERAGPFAAIAKARAGRSTTLAVQEAVQMHGGMGMTDAFDIGFFMKRARVTQELLGDAAFQADALARLRGY